MKKLTRLTSLLLVLVMLLSACGGQQPAPEGEGEPEAPTTREITDMAGRTVTIPTEVTKVVCWDSMAKIFMYTLARDLIGSISFTPTEGEARFYTEEFANLPILGDNSGKKTMNPEELVALAPDFVLNVCEISDENISKVDELQNQTNIPVIMISYEIEALDSTYRFMGDLLGRTERAEDLAVYARRVLDDVETRAATIADEDRVSVYYAEGDEGLQTDPEGSPHAQAFSKVGAINVAETAGDGGRYGRVNVNMEQIMSWNPDCVVFCPTDSIYTPDASSIYQDLADGKAVGNWQDLPAVKNGNFYEVPYGLDNMIDRPACVSLLCGFQWLGNLLYPEVFDYDMSEVVKEYYSLFFQYELSDEEVTTILSRSTLK